jgi:hypothetical protein
MEDKYIKYKTKYLKLKNNNINNMIGGNKQMIIHEKKIKLVEYKDKKLCVLNNIDSDSN